MKLEIEFPGVNSRFVIFPIIIIIIIVQKIIKA